MKTKMQTLPNNSFRMLSENVQAGLLKSSRQLCGNKDEILMHKGDPIGGVIIVRKGTLRVFSTHQSGREATLYRVSDNEICLLSMNSSFAGLTYPAWVSVESDKATIAMIPIAHFREIFIADRTLQDLVILSLNSAVKDLLVRLDEALLSSLKDRIHSFLMTNADPKGQVKVTHDELAQHLGSSREVISRNLGEMKKSNIISSVRGTITLLKKSLY